MAHSTLFHYLRRVIAQAQSTAVDPAVAPLTPTPDLPRVSRRTVLRCSTLAIGATMARSALACTPIAFNNRQPLPRIAIVGGGIAGLSAAYHLQKLGLPATVYEAKPWVGGRIQSREGLVLPGLVNDLGAAFINTDHTDLLTLVEELGIELFDRRTVTEALPYPDIAFYFAGQRLEETALVAALAPLAVQIGQDGGLLEQDFDRYVPGFDALSVADYLDLHQDKIGQPYGRSLIEASIRSEYGVEPEQSSALQLLYNLPRVRSQRVELLDADEVFLVQGGTAQIPKALAAQLGDAVQTGWRLQSVALAASLAAPSLSPAPPFRLGFNQGVVEADYVILALPFPALRRVDLAIDLPAGLRQFIQAGNPGRNEKLFAGFSQRPWLAEHGFTGAAWSDLGYSGIWEDTQRQPDQPQGVLTFFMGGQEVDQHQGAIAVQGQRAIDQLSPQIAGLQDGSAHRYARTGWGQDPDFGGAYTNLKPGQYSQFRQFFYVESEDPAEQQIVRVGNLLFAGEQFSDEYYGYMNGAAQTGRLAATQIQQQVVALS